MDDMKEFVAYLRRLRRDLAEIKAAINSGDTVKALKLITELEEDTTKDIET